MRIPLSWVRDYVDLPDDETPESVGERLVSVGLELEEIEHLGADVTGTLVVGLVRSIEELTEFKKPIRFCQVEVGEPELATSAFVHGVHSLDCTFVTTP